MTNEAQLRSPFLPELCPVRYAHREVKTRGTSAEFSKSIGILQMAFMESMRLDGVQEIGE